MTELVEVSAPTTNTPETAREDGHTDTDIISQVKGSKNSGIEAGLDDFITVLSSKYSFIGKRFFDPKIKPEQINFSTGIGQTVRVNNIYEMKILIEGLKQNQSLVLGYIKGTEPDINFNLGKPYQIVPQDKLSLYPDAFARLKETYSPSSWACLDKDNQDMAEDEWFELLEKDINDIIVCAMLKVDSSSTCIFIDEKPYRINKAHYFIKVTDANDKERFAMALKSPLCRESGNVHPNILEWVKIAKSHTHSLSAF